MAITAAANDGADNVTHLAPHKKRGDFRIFEAENSVTPKVEISNIEITNYLFQIDQAGQDDFWDAHTNPILPRVVPLSRLAGMRPAIEAIARDSVGPKQSANDGDDDEYPGESERPSVIAFCTAVSEAFIALDQRVHIARERGIIPYDMIAMVLKPGDEVAIKVGDDLIGSRVLRAEMIESLFGVYIDIRYSVIAFNGKGFVSLERSCHVWPYDGARSFDELPIRILDKVTKDILTQRGQAYVELVSTPHYVQYTGSIVRQSYWANSSYRADGRAMIDVMTLQRIDPNYYSDLRLQTHQDAVASVSRDRLFMCDAVVYGFSLAAKKWGNFRIEAISPIQFRKDAIEKLVLDDRRKAMVTALVRHSKGSFADIVDGKGGGCIFLLHGKPGVGKTLTAEAVAEYLEKPLYSVSVGELGTDPASLEASLREILDVATSWDAVVLLDEADIFLEARNERDIVRNAMVGVFLRLLEYHQGVLFLTTNRVRNFDPAFHSRISVALSYDDLEGQARETVWRNLLKAAGITSIDDAGIKDLASRHINGRQIKNAIRIGHTLAKEDNGGVVTMRHILEPIELANEFMATLRT